jgi:aminoglycoside phosphotransferase family enzyme/predicted kinase
MDIAALISALSDARAFPFPVTDVEVRQTHISVVFLAGDTVYKIKKPVRLSFLDFSTLEKRRHFCDEEVRLNRRLAPDVYLGVVPVTSDGPRVQFEGAGEIVDWAVKMRRLPESATLEQRLLRDEIEIWQLRALASRLAKFHADAARSGHIAGFGRFTVVAGNIRENFAVSAPTVGLTISPAVRERLMALTERALSDLEPLIEARALRGAPCDTHGDLHLDHVYLFPERPAPADLVVIDCIEFNERFRYADPVADMAFLVMDLEFHGRRNLANEFAAAYFGACGDDEGRRLLPLYVCYRAAVRAKVDGLQLAGKEIPEAARNRARMRARGHWLLALSELEVPGGRTCLVLIGGLPGTGKSSLAASLATRAGFEVIRSDVVRKEIAGIPTDAAARAADRAGIYTDEWTDRTYAECLRRAEERLFQGKRVIIDASFVEEECRRPMFEAALRWGVPALFLVCQAEPATVKARLDARRDDASDADWPVYLAAARRWEDPGQQIARATHIIDSGESAAAAVEQAWNVLREAGLVDGTR